MSDNVEVKWIDSMAFEAEVSNHKIILDASEAVGGNDRGPRPKALTLASLGGCSGMDVISILAKMRVVPEKFRMTITGDLSEEHPKVYNTITIIYHFKGKDLPLDKLEKAVNLSQERYCGVSAMLGKSAKIIARIEVEE
ncbi:MAG: OsmC family protein [Bacteroidales bacterium]